MNRVFVLHPVDLNLRKAEDFGDLEYVFDEHDERPSIWSDEFYSQVIEHLRGARFDSSNDHFLVVGNMMTVTRTVSALQSAFGKFKALYFDAVKRGYVSVTLGDTAYERRSKDTAPNGAGSVQQNPHPAGTGSRRSR